MEVVADKERGLCSVVDLIHPHSAPDGGDTAAPTTILIDRTATVKWLFRPDRYLRRLSPNELLAAVDKYFPANR